MPNVFYEHLETGHSHLFMTGPKIEILTLKAEDASSIVGC